MKVRIWGIDAPELGQRPWGEESREYLQQLLGNRTGMLVKDKDRYGRTVGRLYQGGKDIALAMVQAGQAIVYRRYNHLRVYRQAQRQAQRNNLGIWAKPGLHQRPEDWRKQHPLT